MAVVTTLLACAIASAQISPADALTSKPRSLTLAELPASVVGIRISYTEPVLPMLMGLRGSMGSRDAQGEAIFQLISTTWVDPAEFAAGMASPGKLVRAYTFDLTAMLQASPSGSKMPPFRFRESFMNPSAVPTFSPEPNMTKPELVALEAKLREPEPPEAGTAAPDMPAPKVFPMSEEFATAKKAAYKTQWLSMAKQCALALMIYEGDHGKLPAVDSTAQARSAAMAYLKNDSVWPMQSGKRLLYNTGLSGLPITQVGPPAERVLLWSESPIQGGRVVAYADGHVRWHTSDEWKRVWNRELALRRERVKSSAKRR
ncbi:MAG: hypothetical protein SFX74_07095 [Fimbriimonadaceae bacterium]|nr:hypothetical protein [Fimbriimonadaceae bacterium]